MSDHRERILDQFTKQAEPFSNAAPIADDAALRRIVEATGAGPEDTMLDVACGPGIVVCAFAPRVLCATGIDITPAMIERARTLGAARGLGNVTFHIGDVERLPFADAAFSIVVSRLSFHHFEHPGAVLSEMFRVCRPGGAVAVVDLTASSDPVRAAAGNRVERLRDPSHVRSLTTAELEALFASAGLPLPATTSYRLELELESWLSRSFPDPKDIDAIRSAFEESLEDDALGLGSRREDGAIRFGYDVAICVSRRPELSARPSAHPNPGARLRR
jgi:ubiquinone/menaquinone biosynthesis C-methylase UbiE